MRTDVRILVLGDERTGKSSLVTTLLRESFVSSLQHVIPEVTIPPDWTREKVTTHIVDSSGLRKIITPTAARLENRGQLDAEIRKADVICVVYAFDIPQSFVNISAIWLVRIEKTLITKAVHSEAREKRPNHHCREQDRCAR